MSYSCPTISTASTREAPRSGPAAAGWLRFVGHATTLIEIGGAGVLTDPVLGRWIGPLRRQTDPPARELAAVDAVAVSHLHHDHLDLRSLRLIPSGTPVIVPRGAGATVSKAGTREVIEVSAGDEIRVGDATIGAVPAIHDPRRGPFGPRAEPVGFVVEAGGRRVYFAGDTDLFHEMADLRPLDLALMPVWGWGPTLGPGHMDPAAAARALELLRPRLAIPIHWGTFYPAGLRRWKPGPLSDPPRDFARLAAELTPEVRVILLEPGQETSFGEEAPR